MSYQARIGWPPLMVTRLTGARGIRKRTGPTAARSSSSAMDRKSVPSAPRPCRTMTLARGVAAGLISMVCMFMVMSTQ